MKFFAASALLLSAVSAHFTLDYPTTRGFDEDTEPEFCGGFNSTTTRTAFPLSGGPILIDSHHQTATVGILLSLESDPTSFADFNDTMLMPFGSITGTGEFCFDVVPSAVSGISNGTIGTIQVEFNGGDGYLFQCADVIFTSDAVVPSNYTCANVTAGATSSGASSDVASAASSDAAAVSSAASSDASAASSAVSAASSAASNAAASATGSVSASASASASSTSDAPSLSLSYTAVFALVATLCVSTLF